MSYFLLDILSFSREQSADCLPHLSTPHLPTYSSELPAVGLRPTYLFKPPFGRQQTPYPASVRNPGPWDNESNCRDRRNAGKMENWKVSMETPSFVRAGIGRASANWCPRCDHATPHTARRGASPRQLAPRHGRADAKADLLQRRYHRLRRHVHWLYSMLRVHWPTSTPALVLGVRLLHPLLDDLRSVSGLLRHAARLHEHHLVGHARRRLQRAQRPGVRRPRHLRARVGGGGASVRLRCGLAGRGVRAAAWSSACRLLAGSGSPFAKWGTCLGSQVDDAARTASRKWHPIPTQQNNAPGRPWSCLPTSVRTDAPGHPNAAVAAATEPDGLVD